MKGHLTDPKEMAVQMEAMKKHLAKLEKQADHFGKKDPPPKKKKAKKVEHDPHYSSGPKSGEMFIGMNKNNPFSALNLMQSSGLAAAGIHGATIPAFDLRIEMAWSDEKAVYQYYGRLRLSGHTFKLAPVELTETEVVKLGDPVRLAAFTYQHIFQAAADAMLAFSVGMTGETASEPAPMTGKLDMKTGALV